MQHRSAEAPSLEPTPQVLVLSRAQGLPIALLDHLGLLDDALPFLVLLAFLEGLFLQKWLSMPLIKETSSWHAQTAVFTESGLAYVFPAENGLTAVAIHIRNRVQARD